jgi:hypothetical protein
MAKRYKGFTLEQHLEVAKNLKDAHNKIHDLCWEVVKAYGKTSQEFKKAQTALTKIKHLRNALDYEYGALQKHCQHIVDIYFDDAHPTELPAMPVEAGGIQSPSS